MSHSKNQPSSGTPTTKGKSFKDLPFSERFKHLGDEAEEAFEREWADVPFDRSGWNRPTVDMRKMPKNVCYMPDYVAMVGGKVSWVEVQGCGKDQLFKFKLDKLEALKWWKCTGMPVYLWLWDATHEIGYTISIDKLFMMTMNLNKHGGSQGVYPEGKRYVQFPVTTFTLTEGT